MDCSMPGFPVLNHLPELAQTHIHWVSDAIQSFHPLSLSSLFAISLYQHQGLSQRISSLHQMTKVFELQLQHQSFQWIIRLISFRIDWFDPLAVQGTLKSLPQQHSLTATILQFSAFLMVQLSYQYMATGKIIALTIRTFVSKVMSLLFNRLSRFVITLLSRNKCLFILWLKSPSTVILEPKKIKSDTIFTFSPSICMKWWDQMP